MKLSGQEYVDIYATAAKRQIATRRRRRSRRSRKPRRKRNRPEGSAESSAKRSRTGAEADREGREGTVRLLDAAVGDGEWGHGQARESHTDVGRAAAVACADRLPRPDAVLRDRSLRHRPRQLVRPGSPSPLPGAHHVDPRHPAQGGQRGQLHQALPRRRPDRRPDRHPSHAAGGRPRPAHGRRPDAPVDLDRGFRARLRDQGRLALGGLRLDARRRRQRRRARRAQPGHLPQRAARLGRLHRHRLRRRGGPRQRAHPRPRPGDRGRHPRAGAARPRHPRQRPPGAGHGPAARHRPGRRGRGARPAGRGAGGRPAHPGLQRPGAATRVSEDEAEGALVRAVDEPDPDDGERRCDLRALLAPYAGSRGHLRRAGRPGAAGGRPRRGSWPPP